MTAYDRARIGNISDHLRVIREHGKCFYSPEYMLGLWHDLIDIATRAEDPLEMEAVNNLTEEVREHF